MCIRKLYKRYCFKKHGVFELHQTNGFYSISSEQWRTAHVLFKLWAAIQLEPKPWVLKSRARRDLHLAGTEPTAPLCCETELGLNTTDHYKNIPQVAVNTNSMVQSSFKLTVAQLVRKFLAFHANRRSTTLFPTACHKSPSLSKPPNLFP
jgi:hypothetical protein